MCKKERRTYFESLDPSKIVDNKTFWKNIQPLFSEKRKITNKVTLVGKEDKVISEDSLVSDEINFFFQNATKNATNAMKLMNTKIQLKKPLPNTKTILSFY